MLISQKLYPSAQSSQQNLPIAPSHVLFNSSSLPQTSAYTTLQRCNNISKTSGLYIEKCKKKTNISSINRRTSSLTPSSKNRQIYSENNQNNQQLNKFEKNTINLLKKSPANDNLYYFNDKMSTISSGTSTVLSRFFQRSSPFRRSTATCSSYSSTASGYLGMSPTPSTSIDSSENSTQAFSPVPALNSLNINADLMITPSRKSRNLTFCFNLLRDSSKHLKNQLETKKDFELLRKNKILESNVPKKFNIDVTSNTKKNHLLELDNVIDEYYNKFNKHYGNNSSNNTEQHTNSIVKIVERNTCNIKEIKDRREKALSTYDNI